jgi:hypothetical protein
MDRGLGLVSGGFCRRRRIYVPCDPTREVVAVLRASTASRMHAYIVVSLLTDARTEELRALRWDEVYLEPKDDVPLISWNGARCGRPATPKPGSRGARWHCR